MPKYNVSTQNVVEQVEADTPEEAAARSSHASVNDPVLRVELGIELRNAASDSSPVAGAPEADGQTVSSSSSQGASDPGDAQA